MRLAVLILCAVLAGSTAQAAEITVTIAKIAAGALTITGKSPAANQTIKLDNIYTTKSDAQKNFSFNVAYVPADCIVHLTSGPNTTPKDVAIASCAVGQPKGANITGAVGLSGVANGRCSQVSLNVNGAKAGQNVIVSFQGAVQNGIMFYGASVPSDNTVIANICNFSGTAMTTINSAPVKIITFP